MKNLMKVSLALVATVLLLPGCSCYKKMNKNSNLIETSCTPSPLSLKGTEVPATITVTFPADYFHKKATLKLTPVLISTMGEVLGTPKYVQGESVNDNYTVISKANGGSYTQTVSFPYDPKFRESQLILRVEAVCGKNASQQQKVMAPFAHDIVVADGVSTVQQLADYTGKVAYAPDQFQRTTQISQSARVMFLINSANVRKEQLTNSEINDLKNFIKENGNDPKKSVSDVYAKAYASPDGPTDLNNKLSQERGKNTQKAFNNKIEGENFDVDALGEDWEGFAELVKNSNIQDKDMIIQVLNLYKDPAVREKEIKNMTSTYKVLADKILPELRRTKLTVNVDVQGLTDAELQAAVKNNISSLNLEELLFAATLFNDNATKTQIYTQAANKYNDYRAWNNLAATQIKAANLTGAKASLNKAAQLNNSSNEVVNNLGVIALLEGNTKDAAKYLSSINTPEAKYNMGVLDIATGDYAAATKVISDGYNLAVAEFLNGNVSKAKTLLANESSAKADYLKAVIAAREGDDTNAVANLKSAISKDSSLKSYAATDVEFKSLITNAAFTALVK